MSRALRPGRPGRAANPRAVAAHDAPTRLPRGRALDRGLPGPVQTPRASGLYLALVAGLAVLASAPEPSTGWSRHILAAAGLLSVVTLLVASTRLRARPTSSWMASRRDPFLAFAAAVAVLVLPTGLQLLAVDSTSAVLQRSPWLTGAVAAGLIGCGFLTMLRDEAPGRAIDAAYLVGIGAIAVGLVSWTVMGRLFDAGAIAVAPDLGRLAPVVLDLMVVGLGLQVVHLRSGSRHGSWLLLLAGTMVLVADASELLGSLTGSLRDDGPMVARIVALGLLGAGALHPETSRVPEPVFGPLHRLPRPQVALLGCTVILGPAILVLDRSGPRSVTHILLVSAALSLLVVTYLVHLVQGRAVFEHRAHHDELTGLANRTLFEDRAAVAIAHAHRTEGHSAVLFLDLDRFKNVNDSLGHAVGNLLLQAVAKRLRGATRAEDTVARLGGDEFVVLLAELGDAEEAAVVAASILTSFEDPFTLSGHRLFASPSIGVAVFPRDGLDADTLLKNADIAMYRAKQRGRRTFCTYDRSMNDHAHERLALESGLHSAVARGELRLLYQPKIHLPTGQIMGMEALLRWEHPELGLLEPAEFISLAEESGLIVPVGEWALEEACRQNQAWTKAGFQPLVVAVNLSLRQFQQQRIEDVTARVLRSTGLPAHLLELEVTESLALQDADGVRTTLLDLRAMGVRCSIDDFGTGYSGLSQLTRLPVDKLKIDKSFVATIDADREAPIVVAVVALAHGLGLEVVAEGVETSEQLERLRELGCDEMQGYLFSRPVTAERFEQLLMLESIAPGPGRLTVPSPARPRLVPVAG